MGPRHTFLFVRRPNNTYFKSDFVRMYYLPFIIVWRIFITNLVRESSYECNIKNMRNSNLESGYISHVKIFFFPFENYMFRRFSLNIILQNTRFVCAYYDYFRYLFL